METTLFNTKPTCLIDEQYLNMNLYKELGGLLGKYSSEFSYRFYVLEDKTPMFYISLKGGFSRITIEGIITENFLVDLENSLKDMKRV